MNAYHILFYAIFILGMFYTCSCNTMMKTRYIYFPAKNIPYVVMCVVLILFSGLAGNIATDHLSYIRIYNAIKTLPISEFLSPSLEIGTVEKGYGLILWLIGNTLNHEVWVFLISSALIVIPHFIIAEKTSNAALYIILYITIGSYFAGFNVIRQVIVSGLFCLTLSSLVKGEFKKFIVADLLFSLIHISAIFMIPFYFLLRQKNTFRTMVINISLVTIVTVGFSGIRNFVDTNFAKGIYALSGRMATTKSIVDVVVPTIIFAFCQFLLYKGDNRYLNIKINADSDELEMSSISNILRNGCFYWIVFWILTLRMSYVVRITYFFLPLVIVTLVEGVLNYEGKWTKAFLVAGLLMFIFIYYFRFGQYFDTYILYNG